MELLKIFVLLTPYHYLIFAVLLKKLSILKLWRDIVMILLITFSVYQRPKKKLDSLCVMIVLFTLITVFYIMTAPNIYKAINIARVYLLPVFLFWSMQDFELTYIEIKKIAKIFMVNTVICCVYGNIQAYILRDSFLAKIGYDVLNAGGLSASYYLSNYGNTVIGRNIQRVVSTFSAANIFAFYLCIVFISFLFLGDYLRIPKKRYGLFMAIVGITIVLTFSRSCWLALAIALLTFGRKEIWRFICKMRVIVIVSIIATAVIIVSSNSLRAAIIHIFFSSFSGSDTSILSHYSTIDHAVILIKDHLFGLGLGENGPRALNYGVSNLVESSFLLMVFEFGILGAAVYFYVYFYVFYKSSRYIRYARRCAEMGICLTVFVLIAFLNIPYVQEVECTGAFFLISSICLNRINLLRIRYKEDNGSTTL